MMLSFAISLLAVLGAQVAIAAEISGFVDISASRPGKTEGSKIFYWLAPAANHATAADAPLLIWLQGGPGSSSLLGLFFENGPYYLTEQLAMENRTVGNWNQDFNVLFIDQPIGTGYSIAAKDDAYVRNEEEVAQDLYTFLQQWYSMPEFAHFAAVPLYLTGESYAGHYIPAFAYKIVTENAAGKHEQGGGGLIPLAGVAIGDGLTDPCVQVQVGPRAAFDFGLIDSKTFVRAKGYADRAAEACAQSNFTAAADFRKLMEDLVGSASGINKYDVRTFESYDYMDVRMDAFLNLDSTKEMLNVPSDVSFVPDSSGVAEALYEDKMQSQAYKIPLLLDDPSGVRVLLYQGQFDWRDGPFSNEAWLERMHWSQQQQFLQAPREQWVIENTTSTSTSPAGWVQSYGRLTELVVNGAGHLAPMNQPERLLSMITSFVRDEPFLRKKSDEVSSGKSEL